MAPLDILYGLLLRNYYPFFFFFFPSKSNLDHSSKESSILNVQNKRVENLFIFIFVICFLWISITILIQLIKHILWL